MRALHPMTQEEREFAEKNHYLVLDFFRYRRLSMDDFYDIVIFGYLSAVQQYFRNPPLSDVTFKTMAFRAMKDSVLREREYCTRAKRCGFTVNLDITDNQFPDSRQNTARQVEEKDLLEQVISVATPREAKIIGFLLDGFALREAAHFLKIPKAEAASCLDEFCCRAKVFLAKDLRCWK